MNRAQKELEKWLKGRPEIIKTLARKYPPGTCFNLHGQVVAVVSYEEDGGIAVAPRDLLQADFAAGVKARVPICRCCLANLDQHRLP